MQEIVKNRNIKTVQISVPNEQVLSLIKRTPALVNLTRLNLQVGKNIENVNHYQFNKMMGLYPSIGVLVEEI